MRAALEAIDTMPDVVVLAAFVLVAILAFAPRRRA